ncbi:MAG: type VI secretion system baseplate subunit TssE [Xanthomonadales bacterium]|nr:type VI secretion system baseplate subunit TssE [Xanthomonadales bacterium]
MGQWSLKERLQPSLLDRLTDQQTNKSRESTAQQSMGHKEFKNAVIRDLGWLLNSVCLDVCVDLEAYPEVRNSVLNYGLPDISGQTSSTIEVKTIELAVRKAIRQFEPRIIRNTLQVKVHSNVDEMSHNSLVFEIQGAVFGQPSPFQIVLRSELDLECGEFTLTENFD